MVVASGPTAHAQQKAFKRQRKYVTEHTIPATAEIPVAPEGLPQPEAVPPAQAAPYPDVAAGAQPYAPPAPVASPPPGYYYVQPPVVSPAPATAPAPYTQPAYPGVFVAPAPGSASVVTPTPSSGPLPAPPPLMLVPQQPPTAPPGYVLVPLGSEAARQEAERRAALTVALGNVERELIALRYGRAHIAGPIVQMVIGYGSALAFSTVALSCFGAAEGLQHQREPDRNYDVNGDGSADRSDETTLRRTSYAFTGLAAAGLIVGVAGGMRLSRNREINRAVKNQRRALLTRRESLRKALDYGANAGPGQLQVSVRGRF
ncbi:MAG: hypothetical protein QM778_04565 [Myxococcales bacterium]